MGERGGKWVGWGGWGGWGVSEERGGGWVVRDKYKVSPDRMVNKETHAL